MALLGLAAVLSLSLVACGKWDNSDKYEGIFSPEELEWDAEHEYGTYAVVVASSASADVYDAAVRMAEKLSENTGAYAECFYAHEDIPKGNDVCRIFIGDLGFDETSKYLRGFRAEDIGYKYHDKCVYIGGITEKALLRAIEKFIDDVVVYADIEFFMNEDTEVFIRGEYDIAEIKLAGFSLGEYTLVYPKGDDNLRDIANDFRDQVLDSTGYLLSVSSDAALSAKSRVILLGDCDAFEEHKLTPEADRAKIAVFDAGVMLVSEQPIAIKAALDRLGQELLRADENGCADVRIDGTVDIIFDTTDVSVLSFIPTSPELSLADMIAMLEKVRESYPDIVRFEGVSANSMQSLFYNFNESYALITLSDNTYHMIRKDRYTYDLNRADAVDAVKYTHTDRGAVFNVLELFGECDNDSVSSTMSGACLIFSDSAILDIDGVKSAAAFFEQNHISGIDSLYFAGETLSPHSYVVAKTDLFTYSQTQIKTISFH